MSKKKALIIIVTVTIIILLVLIYFKRRMNKELLNNANVQAILRTIRYAEGTAGPNGYRMMFTGRLFNDFSKHPNIRNTANGITSTAAGAYQFLYRTWVPLAVKNALSDFSPESQDIAAVAKLRERGAIEAILAGDFETAISKINKEWASLPGSPYGQPVKTLAELKSVYENEGGQYA